MTMKISDFIAQQPATVEKVLSDLPSQIEAALPESEPERVILIGTGSSMNALLAASDSFSGLPAELALRSPLTFLAEAGERRVAKSLAIVLSQSGNSSDTIAATKQARKEGMDVIVVTAGRDAPLAACDVKLVWLPVEDETVGPKTKGYTASVLALRLIGMALSGKKMPTAARGFVDGYAQLIETARIWSTNMAPKLAGADVIAVLGQGRHYGSALEGSLKVAEMAGIPSFGLETEEASHGRLHGLTKKSVTIALASNADELDLARRVVAAMAHYGLTGFIFDLAGKEPEGIVWPASEEPTQGLDTLSAVVPFQWLAVDLAAERGLVPEDMPYPGMTQRLGIKVGEAV
ncbi:SIS domain-containing protein [Afifella sp. JA880]|uniref:SIS domain-containing protein n=1 Tax=Afifella sp. JA880 TaxID=2975280 RepID=UPI0021BB0178|nr:SIS domain-containing protein [Afifella sp. JA880]MCT8266390.1 SIS domain-containing protein [Afifella sp. JA880]